nr:MAG TPA: DnaJ [Caudoviricetes sp.]
MEKKLVVRRFLFNFAAFNKSKLIEIEKLFQYMEGHFLCSDFSKEIRYRRIVPCIHCNGVCVPLAYWN